MTQLKLRNALSGSLVYTFPVTAAQIGKGVVDAEWSGLMDFDVVKGSMRSPLHGHCHIEGEDELSVVRRAASPRDEAGRVLSLEEISWLHELRLHTASFAWIRKGVPWETDSSHPCRVSEKPSQSFQSSSPWSTPAVEAPAEVEPHAAVEAVAEAHAVAGAHAAVEELAAAGAAVRRSFSPLRAPDALLPSGARVWFHGGQRC